MGLVPGRLFYPRHPLWTLPDLHSTPDELLESLLSSLLRRLPEGSCSRKTSMVDAFEKFICGYEGTTRGADNPSGGPPDSRGIL